MGLSVEELKKQLEDEKQNRASAFMEEVKALEEKHKCTLMPVVTIVGNEIQTGLRIVAS